MGIRGKEHIRFFAKKKHLDIFEHPKPASKCLPMYFHKIKPQIGLSPQNSTVKRCVPFIDAMTSGYIISMWCDVYVRAENENLQIQFPDNIPLDKTLEQHSIEQFKGHPYSDDKLAKTPLKWVSPWGVETRKGWSCLFTSPLNHLEKRFKIMDGVVDTDTYYNQVHFPFVWTGGEGEFLIKQGTPLVQVIPFKRGSTQYSVVEQNEERVDVVQGQLGTLLRNAYRSLFWHKR